jgi:apolipoprotein N-acyltransferase
MQRVPLRSGSTVATRLGFLPELLLAAVAALAVLTGLVQSRARAAG